MKKILLILLCLGLVRCIGAYAQDNTQKHENARYAEVLKNTPLVMIITVPDRQSVTTREQFNKNQQKKQELMTDDEWKSWIQRHEVKEVDSKMKIIWDKAIICSEAYFSERNEVFSSYKYVIVYRGMHSERNYHFVVALSFDLGSHGCAIEGELNEQGDLIRIRNCNEPW